MVARMMPRARVALVVLILSSLVLTLPTAPASAAFDVESDLAVVKGAYDALRRNLYTEPDTVALLMNAHTAAETVLKTIQPLDELTGDATKQWEIFAQNVRVMVGQSTETLAPGDLAYPLARSLAKTINDLHTYFLDPKQADNVRRQRRGDTSIINFGFTSINVNGSVYVRQVVPNSPIEAAGARSGDRILAVDGQPLTADNRTALLGNPQEGREYILTVQHVGAPGPTDLTVRMRKYIRLALVSKVLEGHIGYIQTFAFYEGITAELDKALADLRAQNVDTLIVDFRGNAGGTDVDTVMGRFLPNRTELGTVKGRTASTTFRANAEGKQRETLPVVVLVDDNSGSAAEIAAIAFKEYDRGVTVGTKTAGALGSTRGVDLSDRSMLSITTSIYTSAKGASLNGIGFTPDIVVERTNDDVLAGRDPQLDAAITKANAAIAPQPTELPRAA